MKPGIETSGSCWNGPILIQDRLPNIHKHESDIRRICRLGQVKKLVVEAWIWLAGPSHRVHWFGLVFPSMEL